METIDRLYASFVRSRRALGRNQRTIDEYNYAFDRLKSFLLAEFNEASITLVDRRVIEDLLIEYMAAGRTTTTANKLFRSLRAFFTWLHDEELIDKNPFNKKLRAPPARFEPKSGYSMDEVRAQLQVLRQEALGRGREKFLAIRDYALFMVLYDTGLRASEVVSMRVEELDFQTGIFTVPAKGGKVLQRHLGEAMRTAINNYMATRRFRSFQILEGWLWRNFSGYRLTRSGLYRMCRLRAEAAGIREGGVHRWRYTHSEVLQDLGWPEEIIMAEMGHSVLSVSRHYRESAIRRRALKQHATQSPADLLVPHRIWKKR